MEINSVEDVNALTEYQKISQIQRIEKKLRRLSFMPLILGIIFMVYCVWLGWSGVESISPILLMVVGSFIIGIGQSNVLRSDLLKQLFELKYGQ
jgi:hypothetical protein